MRRSFRGRLFFFGEKFFAPTFHLNLIPMQTRVLEKEIAECTLCKRLVDYCRTFGLAENRKIGDCDYWARPVPGFGDVNAQLLIIGLAPGAHGANRTGRPFTGDGAGDVLYRALFQHGFANRETAVDLHDGMRLDNVYITNAVKCVPPQNRPNAEEKRACLDWLAQEMTFLRQVKIVLAMGRDAFDSYIRLERAAGRVARLKDYRFEHGGVYPFDDKTLVATYHFSRYNMNTGVLTEDMIDVLFQRVRALLCEV